MIFGDELFDMLRKEINRS